MKILVLINPKAGHGRPLRLLKKLQRRFLSLPDKYHIDIPKSRDELIAKAKNAAANQFDSILGVGGDGTMHDIVEATVGTDIAVGMLPAGRGNDFIRNIRFPQSLLAIVNRLKRVSTTEIDVPMMNGIPFINSGGIGFDAEVALNFGNNNCYIPGTTCYIIALLKTLMKYRPISMKIVANGEEINDRFMMVTIANGQYYGGGMNIAPDALMNDHLLDVCLIRPLSPLKLLWLFPRVYSGKHVAHPSVRYFKTKKISIETAVPTSIMLDGDIRCKTPAVFEINGERTKIIAPE